MCGLKTNCPKKTATIVVKNYPKYIYLLIGDILCENVKWILKWFLLVRREKLERTLELCTDSDGVCCGERAGFGSILRGVFTELNPRHRLNEDQISVSAKLICQHFAEAQPLLELHLQWKYTFYPSSKMEWKRVIHAPVFPLWGSGCIRRARWTTESTTKE